VEKGEASLKWNERAIEMAEAATEPRARNWLGSLLNNTGWTRYGMGQYDQALVLFEKALEFRKEQGNEENTRVARYCVAKCLRSLGRVEESLSQQYELEKEVLAVQNEAGFNWEEIGECLLLLQREEESKTYFAKAYRALAKDEWIVADEPERLERLKGLAGSSLMP
jgi:tetratricopeptide (TPR) repeat protein